MSISGQAQKLGSGTATSRKPGLVAKLSAKGSASGPLSAAPSCTRSIVDSTNSTCPRGFACKGSAEHAGAVAARVAMGKGKPTSRELRRVAHGASRGKEEGAHAVGEKFGREAQHLEQRRKEHAVPRAPRLAHVARVQRTCDGSVIPPRQA